jgi:hypothetical protein
MLTEMGSADEPITARAPHAHATPLSMAKYPEEQLLNGDIAEYHMSLLKASSLAQEAEETSLAPIMTSCVLSHHTKLTETSRTPKVTQFGLLAGLSSVLDAFHPKEKGELLKLNKDPRLLFNVTSPSSTFICGSQGSGKSHTLSCILENCLIPSKAGNLPNPLTAVVFHYDAFISDTAGSPCEAAFLSSYLGAKVRVLCSPTNLETMRVSGFELHSQSTTSNLMA